MSFIDRLEYLMKKNGIKNKSELARVSDIPYTTIDGFYKKGSDNIKLSTLRKLAKCLHCSLDYLTEDSDIIQPNRKNVYGYHLRRTNCYGRLDDKN